MYPWQTQTCPRRRSCLTAPSSSRSTASRSCSAAGTVARGTRPVASASRWCLRSLALFTLSQRRTPPTVVALTDWPPMIPACGWRCRPTWTPTRSRRAAFCGSQGPSSLQCRNHQSMGCSQAIGSAARTGRHRGCARHHADSLPFGPRGARRAGRLVQPSPPAWRAWHGSARCVRGNLHPAANPRLAGGFQ